MEKIHGAAAASHGAEQSFDTKAIWKTFRILLYITVFELILAIGYYKLEGSFSNKELVKHLLNGVFIILTLAKAFFIVGYFMHLKFERMGLVFAIIVPILFIIGLILVLTNESHHWVDLRM